MAGSLNYYGYDNSNTALVSSKIIEETKQNERDNEQDEQINDLYEKIENIPNGLFLLIL